MPLRCPPHAPFFLPTHLDCIVYSLHNDKNLSTKIDGNGPILMKIRLGEVWCCDDEFRSQHSPSHSFIDTGLLSIYYAYNCSLWFHILSYESRSRYDIGVLLKMSTQHGGTSTAALMVMVMAWGVSYVVSTSMWVVIEVGSGPREILSGRIFVRAPNKMGRIFADIMRPSVLPTVEFKTTLLGWFLQYDSPHLRTNWYQYGWYLLQWPSKLDEASGTCR